MIKFHVNIIQLLSFTAIITGLVFSFLLLVKKDNRTANKFLLLLLISLSSTLLTNLFLEFNLYRTNEWLHYLPFTMTYWIGPAFYFYIRCLIQPDSRFHPKHLWHFAPLFLNYMHGFYHISFENVDYSQKLHNFTESIGFYAIPVIFIYLAIAYKSLGKYNSSLLNHVSTIDNLTLSWIKQLIRVLSFSFLAIILFQLVDYEVLIDYTVEYNQGRLFSYRWVTQLILIFTIYWLSIRGFGQAQIYNPLIKADFIVDDKDYSKPVAVLKSLMKNEKLFLNPELNLAMLSSQSGLTEKEISLALNRKLKKNFYYFVNEYRVDEVKKRLGNSKYENLKIMSIAYDCGFNSKATFNRIFKKFTNESPKAFRNSYQNFIPLQD